MVIGVARHPSFLCGNGIDIFILVSEHAIYMGHEDDNVGKKKRQHNLESKLN